jgi:hypothetical protein
MSHPQWYYFLSIEKDFLSTIDFVEVHPANGKTFSNEYAKLLLLIGSEVDVVAKMLCKKEAAQEKADNIDDYRTALTKKFVGLHKVEIELPRYSLRLQPWKTWDPAIAKSPSWWKSYNNVKHERDINYLEANQENTLTALCGLLALLLYLFRDVDYLQPFPELLNHGFPSYLTDVGSRKPPGA